MCFFIYFGWLSILYFNCAGGIVLMLKGHAKIFNFGCLKFWNYYSAAFTILSCPETHLKIYFDFLLIKLKRAGSPVTLGVKQWQNRPVTWVSNKKKKKEIRPNRDDGWLKYTQEWLFLDGLFSGGFFDRLRLGVAKILRRARREERRTVSRRLHWKEPPKGSLVFLIAI